MNYIKKRIVSWEVTYGQIEFTGDAHKTALRLFDQYLDTKFNLETHLGTYYGKHFLRTGGIRLRLPCGSFFHQLKEGDTIFIQPGGPYSIRISNIEPQDKVADLNAVAPLLAADIKQEVTNLRAPSSGGVVTDGSETMRKALDLILDLANENGILREENSQLLQYKERLEKYQNLDYIFEDEKFMEDWLERNIPKALPNLEIIDRQPVATWTESFMANRPDFFCLDKTTRELVIVENKVRGRHRKVESQVLSYKAWAKRNLKKINDRYMEKGLKATENLKFVIITDTTDERLEAICEDNRIALVVIQGGVVFEEIMPYYERGISVGVDILSFSRTKKSHEPLASQNHLELTAANIHLCGLSHYFTAALLH